MPRRGEGAIPFAPASRTGMLTVEKLRAGAAALGFAIAGGLAIAFAVALVTAPLTPRLALAQSAANPNDQPTAGTLPRGTSTVEGNGAADRPTGTVSPPNRIRNSTEVVGSPNGGNRVDPVEHLSPEYRR